MGTRSTIAIQNEDGTISAVYCHWDGYIEYNGDVLIKYWNSKEKVQELIKMGNISSLGASIGDKHDFNMSDRKQTTFYGRDRGDEGEEAKSWNNFAHYVSDKEWFQEFNYIFLRMKGGTYKWYVFSEIELEKPEGTRRATPLESYFAPALEQKPAEPSNVNLDYSYKSRLFQSTLSSLDLTNPGT